MSASPLLINSRTGKEIPRTLSVAFWSRFSFKNGTLSKRQTGNVHASTA